MRFYFHFGTATLGGYRIQITISPRIFAGVCLRLKDTIDNLFPEASSRRQREVQEESIGECLLMTLSFTCLASPHLDICADCSAAMKKSSNQRISVEQPHDYPLVSVIEPQWQWHWVAGAVAAMQYMRQAAAPLSSSEAAPCPPTATTATPVDSSEPCHPANQPAQQGYCDPCIQPGMSTSAASERQVQEQARPQNALRWQNRADLPLRLECARAIMRHLQHHGTSNMDDRTLLLAVRAVEVALYRAAPSRDVYMDFTTLHARLMALLQQRAAAASARRAALRRLRAQSVGAHEAAAAGGS